MPVSWDNEATWRVGLKIIPAKRMISKKPELTNRRASFLAATQVCTNIIYQRRKTFKCHKNLGMSVAQDCKPLRQFAAVSTVIR